MAKRTPKKIIQVSIEDELLMRIDGTVGRVAESQGAFIRDACRLRLKALDGDRLDRQYVDGYRRKPEGAAWARTTARLLSRVLSRGKW
jgi:hypothetical protein